ncbi:HIT family protein [Streptococcus cuniculipharyngis]|uniref:HIT family protein n=1 Tax=Streptococcus cuniculipharyngis TaxID=1562651 RepID=A0A5C5SDC3_9STRE|nr:HIT family protein [Streptococcus cuniculipharyngis]TWS98180.1 HIT family protein [Streptococcus cuniculipharyngis]
MCLICSRIEMIKEKQNPYFVKELKTGYVVLGDHQHFQGYTLFLGKHHVTELDQLNKSERDLFLSEMADVAEAVKLAFGADKMNCELLGNGDAHVHWHLFPRKDGDLGEYGHNGKGPVWWYPMELMYHQDKEPTAKELTGMKEKLQAALEKLEKKHGNL